MTADPSAPGAARNLDLDRLLAHHKLMWRIRAFEEAALRANTEKLVLGAIHPSIGQEGIAVGVCSNLRTDDILASTHRGHGHTLAKGADPTAMMRELLGREGGTSHGKGGSMHIADFSVGMLGANGIVGAGLPLATGAALAAKLEGGGGVAVSFFGDGASNEGSFHGSLNLASIWKLPVLYVCENNRWASGNSAAATQSVEDISVRAVSYNLPGVTVDGTDVLAVYEAAEQAVRRARNGEGPTLVECKTYRWRLHAEQRNDPPDPRPQEEIDLGPQHDPIATFACHLTQQGLATEESLKQIDGEVAAAVDEAIDFAKASPFPKPEDALTDVFAP